MNHRAHYLLQGNKIELHLHHLRMVDSPRIAVTPTRIAEMGIGSFLILAGSASLALCCTGSLLTTNLTRRNSIQILATAVYGIMVVYLISAKRRSRWEIQNEVDSDVDNTWLVRIIVGIVMIIGCGLSLFAVFKLDVCATVVAREVETDHDVVRRRKRRYLF